MATISIIPRSPRVLLLNSSAAVARRDLPERLNSSPAVARRDLSETEVATDRLRTLSSSSSSSCSFSLRLDVRKQRRDSLRFYAVDNDNQKIEEDTGEADIEALEARVGVGRRARKQGGSDESSQAPAKKVATKSWDSMNLAEKAWALYIDPEKGILFWLNKLAYGAIFTIIGAWIVFRFIGPALGWYQLDQPLLSPEYLLEGGP